MAHHYNRQDKLRALTLLRASQGNVSLTSLHTGVPTRILRKWSQEGQPRKGIPRPARRAHSHEQIMEELFRLALAAEEELAAPVP